MLMHAVHKMITSNLKLSYYALTVRTLNPSYSIVHLKQSILQTDAPVNTPYKQPDSY